MSYYCFTLTSHIDNVYTAQVPKAKRGRKKGTAAGASSGEEESEGERMQDDEAQPPRPRPGPRRSARNNPDTADESTGDERGVVTPKARRGKAAARGKSPSVEAEAQAEPEREGSPAGSPLPPLTPSEEGQPEPDEMVTPRSSLKRPRLADEEEEDQGEADGTDGEPQDGTSNILDVRVQRKRIRH